MLHVVNEPLFLLFAGIEILIEEGFFLSLFSCVDIAITVAEQRGEELGLKGKARDWSDENLTE